MALQVLLFCTYVYVKYKIRRYICVLTRFEALLEMIYFLRIGYVFENLSGGTFNNVVRILLSVELILTFPIVFKPASDIVEEVCLSLATVSFCKSSSALNGNIHPYGDIWESMNTTIYFRKMAPVSFKPGSCGKGILVTTLSDSVK